jgi:hypothetical protein
MRTIKARNEDHYLNRADQYFGPDGQVNGATTTAGTWRSPPPDTTKP